MKIVRYPHHNPLSKPAAITIGNFDGVHKGHQTLLKNTIEVAQQRSLLSVAVIMEPLPQQYFKGRFAIDLITPFKQKAQLIAHLGIDVLCVLNFNQRLAALSARKFCDDILKQGLLAQYILVGHDFRFGANRVGHTDFLASWGEDNAVDVVVMPPVKNKVGRISSTIIRSQLANGDFQQAQQALGRCYAITGRVAHGRKLGRSLGYPTLNIELNKGGNPLHGVYVVMIDIAGQSFQGVASVGYNPTVGGNAKRLEVYVLDFNQQVYGQSVEVLFYKKLRNEVEFDSLCALRAAIEDDVQQTKEYFAEHKGDICEPRL
ncbi:bifunctional riboflavin kinase/FAD synthetase [Marinicella gelatinilytica]|uniref:bifunctional riboflavin kinase/FAD synthetase n=1 Tax=Marinicella gelatinilytica TaxID=2996017 RepID=UPI002260B2BE|nr:bifunctional riboflavin kinase/FAD synthetase [Marinicella gelatinilytica]MCX7544589.1 bifunctional riboflavin kinase/FAD synthetase [Marinicella gelatinilytica]